MSYVDSEQQIVRIDDCIVVWDALSKPEIKDDKAKYYLTVMVHPQNPALAEIDTISKRELQEGDFKGNWPNSGHWPVKPIDHEKQGFQDYQGWVQISPKQYNTLPEVFDKQGTILPPHTLGATFYAGCKVSLLVGNPYTYNTVQKGIGLNLHGVMIADNTAPKLNVGSGPSSETIRQGFGFGGQQHQAQGAPAPTVPAQGPQGAPAPTGPAQGPQGAPAPNNNFANGGQPQQQQEQYTMTPAAGGFTRQQYLDQGWSDQALIDNGYMIKNY